MQSYLVVRNLEREKRMDWGVFKIFSTKGWILSMNGREGGKDWR